MNFRLPHSFNIFSFFLLLCVAGGWHEWERKKKSFSMWFIVRFSRAKRKKGMKGTTQKKNRNKWMSGKYSRLETCVSREVYHLLYDLFILTQISIKDFFLLLGDWYNGMNGYEYEKIDVWIFIDCRMDFFYRKNIFVCGFKELLMISIDD